MNQTQKIKLQKSKIKQKTLRSSCGNRDSLPQKPSKRMGAGIISISCLIFCILESCLSKTLLPQMRYWSNILLEKPSAIKTNTEKKHYSLVMNNAKINSKTNAAVENVFKHKKVDKFTLNQ